MTSRVLITGAGGILGRRLVASTPESVTAIAMARADLDVTDRAAVLDAVRQHRPDHVAHLAAMTDVDGCESDPDRAFAVNALASRHVAEACAERGAGLAYVSTDYVFDGRSTIPYVEDDEVGPLSVYGRTKEAGEQEVRKTLEHHYILRTQWVYGPGGPNFVDTMLRLAGETRPLRVVDDQIGCPTYAGDLAEGIWRILLEQPAFGVYHLSSQGQTSWHGFAREIFAQAGLEVDLSPCTTEEFPRPAPRPAYGVLRNRHLELTLGDFMPAWQEGLRRYLVEREQQQR